MIQVEVWSDINCPFCFIGKKNLEAAIKETEYIVEVEWKSFELDPHTHPEKGADSIDMLAMRYGKDREWSKNMHASVAKMAEGIGLKFNAEKIIAANSFNAHRLVQLARRHSLMMASEVLDKLFSGKFIEGHDISDSDVLVNVALKAGLSAHEVNEMLLNGQFTHEVRADEEAANRLGIKGVPYFIFNKHMSLSGAWPKEKFVEILRECAELKQRV